MNRTLFAHGVEYSISIAGYCKIVPECMCRFSRYNSENDETHCQLFLDPYAQIIADGKPEAVCDVICDIGQVLHDLADGQQPDDNLYKTKGRSQIFHSL